MSKLEQTPNTSHKLIINANIKGLALERGDSLKEKHSKHSGNNRSIKWKYLFKYTLFWWRISRNIHWKSLNSIRGRGNYLKCIRPFIASGTSQSS